MEEKAGISFVNKIDEIDPSTIQNNFTLKFEEILKNPSEIPIPEVKESKGSVMDMFAIWPIDQQKN